MAEKAEIIGFKISALGPRGIKIFGEEGVGRWAINGHRLHTQSTGVSFMAMSAITVGKLGELPIYRRTIDSVGGVAMG